jgi:hypothetical protein
LRRGVVSRTRRRIAGNVVDVDDDDGGLQREIGNTGMPGSEKPRGKAELFRDYPRLTTERFVCCDD